MRLKRFIAAGIITVMTLTAAACSGGKDDSKESVTTENAGENNQQKDVKITEIRDEVKKAYGEDYIPNMEYDDVFITETLGLSADDYDEIVAEGPLVSFNIDTFIGVKAKSGKGDAVEEKLTAYRNYLLEDAMMYPTNAVKIQASKVIRHGDCVFFICLGVVDMDTEEQGDEAILELANKNTKIGEDVISGFFK